MEKKQQLSQAIATVERQISEAKSETAKKALTAKLGRLKEDLRAEKSGGVSSLTTLSQARKVVKALDKTAFEKLVEKLSEKPEYAFLKDYSQDRLRRDALRTAKPRGYRFKGDSNAKPTIAQIKKGLKDGTVYYEGRPIRSDVNSKVRLGNGGSVSTETIDLKLYNIRGQVVESGKVVIDYDNETITLGSGKKYKVEPNREYTYRFLKTKIIAVNGIKGLSEFLKEINAPKKALNTVVKAFIDSDESKMATGGHVSKGEMVWNKLSKAERLDFLYENFTPQITPITQEAIQHKRYVFLPKNVKIVLESKYANVEEYAKGGGVDSKAKYKVGDKVYTYQNPDVVREIGYVWIGTEGDVKYKVSLRDENGYSYSSNFINPSSISKTSRKSDALKVKSGKMSKETFKEKWGSEMYLDKYAEGGNIEETKTIAWNKMNSNERFHVLDYQFPRGFTIEEKRRYSTNEYKNLPAEIKEKIVLEKKYGQGGNIEFRSLAKSNNFDIIVPEGRFEVELDSNKKVKSIVHPSGERHQANECPIYQKYKKEIKEYLTERFENGGNIASFNWKNFTLKELSEALPDDVEILKYDTRFIKGFSPSEAKNFYNNKKLTISQHGEAEISKGGENIYLEIKCYNAEDKNDMSEYEVKIYSKENHAGLKEVANSVIEKMKKGGAVSPYTYLPKQDISKIVLKSKQVIGKDRILDGAYIKEKLLKGTKSSKATKISKSAEQVYNDLINYVKETYPKLKFGENKDYYFTESMIQELIDANYSEREIKGFVLGLNNIIKVDSDNEFIYLDGIQKYGDEYKQKYINLAVEASKNNAFELGLKYPNFNWKQIITKYKIDLNPVLITRKREHKSGEYDVYTIVCFVGKDIVIGGTAKREHFKDGKLDYETEERNPSEIKGQFNEGYWGIVSSKKQVIVDVAEMLLSQKEGYVKEMDFLINDLGGVGSEELVANNIKFAKGGNISNESKNLSSMTGARAEAIESFFNENGLDHMGRLKVTMGVGRGHLSRKDFATAIAGERGNKYAKEIIDYVKTDRAFKMAKGGNLGYTYIPNEDIEKIIGTDGTEYGEKVILDGAYVTDKIRTPKMSRTQFEEDVYAYGEGGGISKSGSKIYKLRAEGLNDFLAFLQNEMYLKVKSFTVEPLGIPDVVVTFETDSSLSEIKEKLREIPDSHVMLETVKPINEYTGNREEGDDESDSLENSYKSGLITQYEYEQLKKQKETKYAHGGSMYATGGGVGEDYISNEMYEKLDKITDWELVRQKEYRKNRDVVLVLSKSGDYYKISVMSNGKEMPRMSTYFTTRQSAESRFNENVIKFQLEKGGGVESDRLFNFLKDDLTSLEVAIKENDEDKIYQFFSYWNQHLDSLKSESNERMLNFLKQDLEELQEDIEENDQEDIDNFFSYWGQHLESMKFATGGGINVTDIKKEKQKMLSELFEKCGVFFAFSDKQFEENKTPLKEGEKYVSIGGGGYLPKGKVKEFQDGMEAIERYGKEKVKKNNLAEAEILDELQNHECFYTGDISDVVDLFEGTYTVKQIRDVYNKYREENQEYALGGEITAEEREQALKNYPTLNL